LRNLDAQDLALDKAAAIFRELEHLSMEERRLLGNSFSSTLVKLSHVTLYWDPRKRRILARVAVGKQRHPLPAGVHAIGTYAHPFPTNTFLGDLNDLLERLEVEQRNAAPSAG
jgi:hypothetical protein